jgi:hypothetical protein
MVMIDEHPQPAAQVPLAKHDYVVEALPPNRSDYSLDVCPLPWRARSRQHLNDPERFDLLHKLLTKDTVAVSQEESWRGVPWKRLPELLNRPLGCGMRRHADVHDPPPLVCEHEKDIQHLKSNRGDGKEVDGHHGANVVLKESAPSLGWRTANAKQIFADGALGELDAEFQKLAVMSSVKSLVA